MTVSYDADKKIVSWEQDFDKEAFSKLRAKESDFNAKRFFVVRHAFKPGKADGFWKGVGEMAAKPGAMAEAYDKQRALGFVYHSFMPTTDDGPILCVWETTTEVGRRPQPHPLPNPIVLLL